MATSGQGDFMKQVQHMWSMLDELAESDADAYKTFIQTQLQRGKEELAPAQPWICVKTTIIKPEKATLYINICSWSRIDKPKTSTEAIKVTAGPVQNEQDASGAFKVVRVAFNPDVLEECSRRSEEKHMLIGNAIDYLRNEKRLHLSSDYHICHDTQFKGNSENLVDFFSSAAKSMREMEREQSTEKLSKLTPDLLLNQLKVSADQSSEVSADTNPDVTLNLNEKPDRPKGTLIQELSSQDARLQCPEYDVSLKNANEARQRRIVVKIRLPGVCSVTDCDLKITKEELSLLVAERYELHLPLPEIIKEDDSTAKFNSKTSSLTVTMPTMDTDN